MAILRTICWALLFILKFHTHKIQPTNKLDVGKRLWLAGFPVAYNRNVYHTGPLVSVIKKRKEDFLHVYEITYKFVRGRIEVRSRDGFEVHCDIVCLSFHLFYKTFSRVWMDNVSILYLILHLSFASIHCTAGCYTDD